MLLNMYNLIGLSKHDNDHHHYELWFKILCYIEMMCLQCLLRNICFKKHIVSIHSTPNKVRDIQNENMTN